MADLDPIGPLKPAVPPAKRKERQRKPDGDSTAPRPGERDKPQERPKSDGPPHQVDEYA